LALLYSLLQGRTMSVPELVEAAKWASHKSKSKNFRTIDGLALLNHQKMFTRVSRGQYTARQAMNRSEPSYARKSKT